LQIETIREEITSLQEIAALNLVQEVPIMGDSVVSDAAGHILPKKELRRVLKVTAPSQGV
jgi:hypothetical protein